MSDDLEPPYVEASVSAEWTADIPDWVMDDGDLYSDEEVKDLLIEQLDLNRESVVDGSVSVSVNRVVTWKEDDE